MSCKDTTISVVGISSRTLKMSMSEDENTNSESSTQNTKENKLYWYSNFFPVTKNVPLVFATFENFTISLRLVKNHLSLFNGRNTNPEVKKMPFLFLVKYGYVRFVLLGFTLLEVRSTDRDAT